MENFTGEIFWLPAVKKIKLHNIGIFKDASLEFVEGMNIITGDGGTGKTTILQSLIGSTQNRIPEGYLIHRKDSEIVVEYRDKKVKFRPNAIPPAEEKPGWLSVGDEIEMRIDRTLKSARSGYSLILDADITSRLVCSQLRKFIDKLDKVPCQKIIVLSLRDVNVIEIPNTRVFKCVYNKKGFSIVRGHILR